MFYWCNKCTMFAIKITISGITYYTVCGVVTVSMSWWWRQCWVSTVKTHWSDEDLSPLVLAAPWLRVLQLLHLLGGGVQPLCWPTLPEERPLQRPGDGACHGAERRRASPVFTKSLPPGRVGELPPSLFRGPRARRRPWHRTEQQHQVPSRPPPPPPHLLALSICSPWLSPLLPLCVAGTPSTPSRTPRLCSASPLTRDPSARWWNWTARRSSGTTSQSSPRREVRARVVSHPESRPGGEVQ